MFSRDDDGVSRLTDEVDRVLGKFVRRRAVQRAAQRAVRDEARHVFTPVGKCGSCREPLHGRLCYNPGCADSIHDAFSLPPAETILTVGEESPSQ